MDIAIAEPVVQAAHDAGCPPDQIERFLVAGYIPQPVQLRFHAEARKADALDGPTWVGMGGARGGSKSHATMAQVGLDDCQRTPGLKALFLRKVQKSAAESMDDLVFRVFKGVRYDYSSSEGRIEFANGSRILLGGYNNESDINKYIGVEYDEVVIEEATQLSEDKIVKLRGSVRTSRNDWRVRIYPTTNPGGIGHNWFKKAFIDPHKLGTQGELTGNRTAFVPANYHDNAFLASDYIEYLDGLPEPLRSAWRDGNWDIFEGMAFPGWRADENIVDPYELPSWWPRWRAVDWGYSAPFCCLWFAKDPDSGRVYVYRELYQSGLTDRQQARLIREYSGKEQYTFTYSDPSMFSRKNTSDIATSSADEYNLEGVYLTRADNERVSGKRKVDRMLSNLTDGKPGLLVFNNCRNLIRTLPSLVYDEHNAEDIDTNQEDHAYDALRYGLSSLISYTVKPFKGEQSPLVGIGVL